MTTSTLPSVSFNSASGPFTLTTDSSKIDGLFTLPDVTTTDIDGQTMKIGGGSQSATMKDGSVSLGPTTFNILSGSWTEKNETLSVQGSVTFRPNVTVTFTGSDVKKGIALSFTDEKASEEAKKTIESGSEMWKYETVKKDPNYDTAGVIGLGPVVGWSKSLTLSVTLDLKVDANKENVTAVRTHTVSLGLRPLFAQKPIPDPDDSDSDPDYPATEDAAVGAVVGASTGLAAAAAGAAIGATGLCAGATGGAATAAVGAGAAYLGIDLAAKGAIMGAAGGPAGIIIGAAVGGVIGIGAGVGTWLAWG